jgi:hypothetical protein
MPCIQQKWNSKFAIAASKRNQEEEKTVSDTNTPPNDLKSNLARLSRLEQEEHAVAAEQHHGFQDAVLLRNIQSEIEDLNTEVWHQQQKQKASGS